MTDQPSAYTDPSDVTLTIDAARGWGEPGHLSVSIDGEGMQIPSDFGLLVPTARLLAMIDAEDPDAMRAYLRETAPQATTVNVHAVETGSATLAEGVARVLKREERAARAADHFDYLEPEQLDAVPEADSPEDVDERPGRDDPTERAQLDRAWALELAHRLFPHAGSLLALKVAAWVIDGQQR